jgi:hypothetical protein
MRTFPTTQPSDIVKRNILKSSLITGAVLLAPWLAPAQAARFLSVSPTFASGGVPQLVVTADVNKDGIPDLITSNENGKVTLLRGTGNGSFAPPTTLATMPGGACPVAMGDFNNDGVPDLAVLAKSANSVWIYLGHGDGTFAAPSKTATPASSAQIAVADVNGDGHADVVAASPSGLSSYLGDGHGGLQPAITTSASLRATALALGDVNGDGRLDLIVGTLDGDIEFVGLGDGHFKQTTNQVDAGGPYTASQLVLSDLDGDGKLDLVVGDQTADPRLITPINISWGNGDGTFQIGTPLRAGSSESGVVVGDFNNDGRPDLASADSYSNSVSVLLNRGDRTFAPAVSYRTNRLTFLANLPNLLSTSDFNGDGRPDLALATLGGVQVIRNAGGGKLYAPGAIQAGGTGGPALYAVLLNGDAHQDLTVESIGPFGFGTLLALYGDGTGQFPQRFNPLTNAFFGGLGVGDFNRDGRLDLVYGSSDNGVFTLINTGRNAFANGPAIDNVVVFDPVAGDFNNDGFSDLAINDGSSIVLYLNHADGTFGAVGSYATGSQAVSMKAMDINKDGKRDLIMTDDQSSQIIVLLGNGNGTFQPARLSPVSQIPSSFTVGDFNRDGRLDVAVGLDQSIEVLPGRGDGTFAAGASYSTSGPVSALSQTDLRHDDKEDLLFVDGQALWVMLGNGDGTFHAPSRYNVGPNPISLAVGDFNEDGAPDVAVSDAQSTALALLLNTGGTRIALKSSASSVHAGQAVTFTATVTASVPGTPVPTGTVAFKDGSKGIGSVHLSNGQATFTTTALSLGTHAMTASYWETSSFNPHVSAPITESVVP